MAIKATGQITIVDLSDNRQLSVYLTANLPKTQILDLSTGAANPDWTQENLEITPNILLNQANIPLTDTNLTVAYKRKDGSGAESSLVAGETITNNILKVNKNILESSSAKSITYICYVSYLDTKLNLTVKAQADINFSLVTSGTEGVGVNEIKEYYYSSTSATELAGGEWSETYPGWESGKYIWTKSIIIYTDNTTKETTPICVSGADGKDGANGKDGENGKDGTNGSDGRGIVSTTIEYQSSTSGTVTPTGSWQTSVPNVAEGNYLWTRTTINYTDNTNSISYSVSYVAKDGKDGENGTSGSDGVGISATNITYQKSTNGQTIPTGTWITSIPSVSEGEYLWTRTEFVYTDNSKKYAYSVGQMGKSGQDGTNGTDGVGIESVDVYYYLSTSSTTQTGGSWSTTAPTWVNGKYMWSKTIVTYTDKTTKESDPVCITGAKGATGETTYFHIKYSSVANPTDAQITDTPSEYIGTYVDFNATASTSASKYTWVKFQGTDGKDGENGTPGTNGINGETSYLHIAYANSADGTTDFSTTDSINKKYMGQYVDFAEADSTNPDDYKWSLIKGADGTNGEDGSDGRGISATTVTYQVSSSGTTAPTGTWTSSIPTVAQGKYLWTKTTITYTDNTTSDSYSVSRAATDGSQGVGIQSVTNKYAVSTSNTTEPTTWYDTPQTMTSTKKYLWNYEIITYTNSTTTETDARVIGVYGDTGQNGSNGTNGEDGKGISNIKEYYQVSTSNTTAPTTWSESVVAMSATNKYLWNYEVITYTDNTTTETSKRVIGVYGDKGATGSAGRGISSTAVTYQASTSGTTTPSGTWLTSIPTVAAGSYLWTRTVVTYTDNTTSTSYSVGKMGNTGSAGKDGTSITIASTSVTYQASSSGTTTPTGTWVTSVPTVSNGQYLWTKTVVTYSDSTSTTAYSVAYKGTNGTNGTNGKDGTSVTISSKSVTYQASTSGTTTPTGTWSSTVPSVTKGQYLWTKTVVTYSTGDSTTSYSVAYQGTNGTNGTNGTSVTVSSTTTTYQKSNSPTTIPTGTWSSTVVATDTTNKYLWTKVVVTFSDGKTATSYSVSSTMDSIAVGGRNYVLNSANIAGSGIGSTAGSRNEYMVLNVGQSYMTIPHGTAVTISFDLEMVVNTANPTLAVYNSNNKGPKALYYSTLNFTAAVGTTIKKRCSVQNTITDRTDATKTDNYIEFYSTYDTSNWFSISNLKLEIGNVATDWTPAPEDMATEYQLQAEAKTLQESINTINQNIRADVEADMQNLKSVIEDDYAAAIDAKATATKKEIDETTGQKVRDLEKYTSELKVNGSSFNYSIEKTKGTNLIKNSVMLQNKQNTSSQTKANFWLNKNLEEDFFTNVTCSDVDSIRAKTDSGSAIIFDYSTDATGLTYDYILSTPIDFKINTDNIMLSYKIKSTISAGTFFAGLVFYKKDTTATGLGATTAFAQTTGIPTAHYLALNEYDTSSEYADFTQDYVLRTTPFVKSDKKRVTWTCEVSEEKTITLPYEPYLVNDSCEVTIYNLDNTTSTVATTGTTVTLDDEIDWPSAVAISYDRAISNFAGTTATSITASNFSTVLVNEVLIYYNTSDKKIWVYNPFTGAYVKSANLYNSTDYSEVDSVRVILGVRGASTSAKFKGHVEISDLKVEFDSLSTIWTQHPGETYSKQYTMDEKGFSISSDTNMMFIDEDEIAAYTLDDKGKPNTDDPVFQISGEETILKKTVVKEDLLIENTTQSADDAFIMKQYYVNNQWFFLFY